MGVRWREILWGGVMMAVPAILSATSYRVVEDEAGRYWFEREDGERFVSIGVNHIGPSGWRAREGAVFYKAFNDPLFRGDYEAWQADVISTLREAGFNTIGAWSDPALNDGSMYEMPILYVGGTDGNRPLVVWRPDAEEIMRGRIEERLAQIPHPDMVVGFFLDNEAPWWGRTAWTVLPNYTLLERAVDLPADHSGRGPIIDWLRERHGTIEAFNTAWGIDAPSFEELNSELLGQSVNDKAREDRDDFTALTAERFLEMGSRLVREAAPGKLVLGMRFAGNAPDSLILATGRHCDVISVNTYETHPFPNEWAMARYWLLGGRPMMITEYSWRAEENQSGNPNTRGAGTVVKTQAERASNYSRFVSAYLQHPTVMGMHWFEFADQSPQGRFDGEDSNYGIIDIYHRWYPELLEAMSETNHRVADLRQKSDFPRPTTMPRAGKAVTVEIGQYPDRPPVLDLIGAHPAAPPLAFAADDASAELATPGGRFELDYQTGDSWGCGFTVYGPASCRVPDAAIRRSPTLMATARWSWSWRRRRA